MQTFIVLIVFLENRLICIVAIPLKHVGNQSANQLTTRKTFYQPVWSAKGFRCSCKNIKPTKTHSSQSPTSVITFCRPKKNLPTTSDNQLPNRDFKGCRYVGDRSLLLCDLGLDGVERPKNICNQSATG